MAKAKRTNENWERLQEPAEAESLLALGTVYSQYGVTEDAQAQVRKCFVLLSRVSLCVSHAKYMLKNCPMLVAQCRPSHELHFVVLSFPALPVYSHLSADSVRIF